MSKLSNILYGKIKKGALEGRIMEGKSKNPFKNKTVVRVIVCVVLLVVVWGSYVAAMEELHRRLEPVPDDFSWVYQIDAVETAGKKLVLRGFAFQLKRDAAGENFEIILQDISTGKNIFPKMKYTEREDVNRYFLCEYDYLQSGFEAAFKTGKLDLQDGNYEVLLRPNGERKRTYRTGIYLAKGQLVYTNPTEFQALDVAGTDLEEVVNNGVLRVYRPDYGMYVYQYEGELYWIAEPGYGFNEDGDSYVQYQLDTTQIANLPEGRLNNQWYWDNIGFQFSSKELSGWNTGKYRVAKERIPTEYSITKIWTGNHINGWIWIQYFRPYYRFEE